MGWPWDSPCSAGCSFATAVEAASVKCCDPYLFPVEVPCDSRKLRSWRPLTAENGREGVAIFEREAARISAVILDMTMPVMTGEQALPLLKQVRQSVPVILSSGFTEADVTKRFGEMALDGFVQKPYTAANLAKAVQQAIRGA